jgi:hypothetical protein
LFPIDVPDAGVQNTEARAADMRSLMQRQRAELLMREWDPERAEDIRRINRTGNFAEGWLVPDRPERP